MKKYMLVGVALLAGSVECVRQRYNDDAEDVIAYREEKQERQDRQKEEEASRPPHIAGDAASRDEERNWRLEERRSRHDQSRREAGYRTDERERRAENSRWRTGYKAGYRTPGHGAEMVNEARRGSEEHPNMGRYQERFHAQD